MPHIRGAILSETLSGCLVSDRRIKTVAGLRWLWLRKEATPTASRTTLSSSLAPVWKRREHSRERWTYTNRSQL
ncbi:hypothetical protein H8959_011446 [Pygathrix nigripes]